MKEECLFLGKPVQTLGDVADVIEGRLDDFNEFEKGKKLYLTIVREILGTSNFTGKELADQLGMKSRNHLYQLGARGTNKLRVEKIGDIIQVLRNPLNQSKFNTD